MANRISEIRSTMLITYLQPMFLKQDMSPFEGYIIPNNCAPKYLFSTTIPFLTLKIDYLNMQMCQ